MTRLFTTVLIWIYYTLALMLVIPAILLTVPFSLLMDEDT